MTSPSKKPKILNLLRLLADDTEKWDAEGARLSEGGHPDTRDEEIGCADHVGERGIARAPARAVRITLTHRVHPEPGRPKRSLQLGGQGRILEMGVQVDDREPLQWADAQRSTRLRCRLARGGDRRRQKEVSCTAALVQLEPVERVLDSSETFREEAPDHI
ncbi:MAG: hypothetical protein ACYCWW_00665 [Deltaproteobacteria bacterium]